MGGGKGLSNCFSYALERFPLLTIPEIKVCGYALKNHLVTTQHIYSHTLFHGTWHDDLCNILTTVFASALSELSLTLSKTDFLNAILMREQPQLTLL